MSNGSFKHEVQLMRALRERAATHSHALVLDVAVYQRSAEASGSDWGLRLREFGASAAERLHQLLMLHDVRVAGVGWGGTVAHVVTSLAIQGRGPRREGHVTFIPTCGEALHAERTDVSSSFLAKILDESINNSLEHHHSLTGVPAFIPADASDAEADTIRKFVVKRSRGYQSVFEGPEPLIDQMDLILTSLASPDQPRKMYTGELKETDVITPLERVRYDIGGVNIPKNPTDATDRVFTAWNNRWTGIKLTHYQHCARRAFAELKPGVVVAAIGESKAPLVLDAIDRGLINTLLIDDELAHALIRALDEPGRGSN